MTDAQTPVLDVNSPTFSNEALASLALVHLPGVGATRYHKLIEWFGSADAVVMGDRKLMVAAGVKPASVRLLDQYAVNGLDSELGRLIKRDLDWASEPNNSLLLIQDKDYPPLLKHIDSPPPVLYIKGARGLLSEPQLAMVGSRSPSIDGKENAYRFAKSIVNVGLVVTSGMALGVDGAAHKGAIDGGGHTIAVVGTGLDITYPARHRGLSAEILERGAIVSELPLGTQPHPSNFPRRNRIISALSLGVLVVEASPRSGSLITAHCALDQGREVYAIPGSIHNPMARGCHQLLRQGAKLVESADDIFEELSSLLAFHQLIRNDAARAPAAINKPPQVTADLFESESTTDPASTVSASTLTASSTTTTATTISVEPPEHFPIALNDAEKTLLDLLGYDVVSVDLAVERSALSAEDISILMMSLELKGVVQAVPGGFQKVRESITA
ncbi:DNA-processing protein DprA [Alkalimarinus alittae]|uniref:DNA-processing protein DprA n=1 Tax=Alkalimarinus alittae TaxID=2961619 RepID=A0ABY6N201_9ALTE|nr:DNA-processing protein DprA [Alkalimarinus alittae]UZE96126.1 DNA-processing protein DprA [Alkalimarinus alittae]